MLVWLFENTLIYTFVLLIGMITTWTMSTHPPWCVKSLVSTFLFLPFTYSLTIWETVWGLSTLITRVGINQPCQKSLQNAPKTRQIKYKLWVCHQNKDDIFRPLTSKCTTKVPKDPLYMGLWMSVIPNLVIRVPPWLFTPFVAARCQLGYIMINRNYIHVYLYKLINFVILICMLCNKCKTLDKWINCT